MNYWLLFTPAYLIRLKERGRIAFSPGPGGVLGDEPPLPRIERAIGALAEILLYEEKIKGVCKHCPSEGLEAYEKCLLGKLGIKAIIGPFLVTKTSEPEIYVMHNKSLIPIEEAVNKLEISRDDKLPNSFLEFIKEEEELGIPLSDFAFTEVHVSLISTKKSVAEGHLFSVTAYDYWKLGTPLIAYWVKLDNSIPNGIIGALGSMRPLGIFTSVASTIKNPEELYRGHGPFYVISAVPVYEADAEVSKGVDQLAPTFDICKEVDGKYVWVKKREPIPAFLEGSILSEYKPSSNIIRALNREQLNIIKDDLRRVVSTL